jgi:hypothetical protein
MDSIMPTLYQPQLTDTATPWLEIWERMDRGLRPRAREILGMLEFYAERDLDVAAGESELTSNEIEELVPIASALTIAAVESQKLPDGVLAATLSSLAKEPGRFSLGATPPAVQWELANDYRRGDESSGSFPMDIWGSDQTLVPYIWGEPILENISRAAEAATARVEAGRRPGRPLNPANQVLADRLGNIFRSSGQPIVRHREKQVRHDHLVYVETGPFFEFLRAVVPPLSEFLRERSLPPVTIETVVRLAILPREEANRSPDFSHNKSLFARSNLRPL